MVSMESQVRLNELRMKQRSGQTLTIEELRESLKLMRGDRTMASATSDKAKTSKAKAKAPIDSDAMLGELDGL